MRTLLVVLSTSLFATIAACACATRAQSSMNRAADFVARMEKQAPTHDDIPLRTYEIRDLDHDGKFEVLEHISAYEDAPGFLNVEISPAFEWINIYSEKNGRFVDEAREFPSFLNEREEHYDFWLRVIEHPEVLDQDSQKLIENNKKEFREVISGYLQKIETLAHGLNLQIRSDG